MAVNKPLDLSNKMWASAGTVEQPTDTKIASGWTVEVPKFQTENWVQGRNDQAIGHINERGIAEWDATTNYIAGKSYVQGSDGKLYISKSNSGPSSAVQNPVADNGELFWEEAFVGKSEASGLETRVTDLETFQTSTISDIASIDGQISVLDQFNVDLANAADPTKGAALVGRVTRQFMSIAELRNNPGRYQGDQADILGYYASSPGVGTQQRYWDATSNEDDNGGSVIKCAAVETGRWKFSTDQGVWVEDFGARNDGTDVAGTTAAVWAAIRSLRRFETSLFQYIGGPTVTAYKSGRLKFGRGVFALAPDTFEFTQDLGLELVGQGFRGKNQAIPAATTLLCVGASDGFFFRHVGNGARSLHFEELDVAYEDASFTGDVIDTFTSPGLSLKRVRVGCYGGVGASRAQSARSLLRSTYDEFINCSSVIFDGCVDAWWSDNSRSLSGVSFGGWGTTFDACTFYDVTGNAIKHDASRTRAVVNIRGCAFNPINVDCVRGVDVENIEGLVIEGCQFTPSTSKQPSVEWFRIRSSTGKVEGNTFSTVTSKLGTIGGISQTAINWANNRVAVGGGGLTLAGGVLTGGGNEYSTGAFGLEVVPEAVTTLDVGPDIFKAGISGNSYLIPADSTNLGGRVNYIFEQDGSNSKFSSVTTRVTIENVDKRIVTIGSLPTTASPYFSGRTYNVVVAGTFTLPTPQPGIRLRVLKGGTTALTVATTAGSNFVAGVDGSRTSAIATASETGSQIEFVALNGSVWVATPLAGTWTFT